MEKTVSTSLESRLSPKKIRSTGLHDKRFDEVVNYLHTTYATGEIISRARKKLKSYRKASGVIALLYAKRLYTKTLRCRIVYEEKKAKSLFDEGLDELICNNMGV